MPAARSNKPVVKPPKVTGPGSDEPFTWITEAGGKFTVPSLAKMFRNTGELRRMRRMGSMDLVCYVIERDCDETELAAFDSMDMDEFERFSEAWAEHSGIAVGES